MPRKHQAIIQSGGNKGKLKKGYRYSGKKLKSGLPQIIKYKSKKCDCGVWLRPDIVWFGDNLDRSMVDQAYDVSGNADLFISIGTSGEVWPAAGIPQIARENNARMIEINPEETEASQLYDDKIRKPSSIALTELFDEY